MVENRSIETLMYLRGEVRGEGRSESERATSERENRENEEENRWYGRGESVGVAIIPGAKAVIM